MTREEAFSWCRENGYCFIEADGDEVVYTHESTIRREKVDDNA